MPIIVEAPTPPRRRCSSRPAGRRAGRRQPRRGRAAGWPSTARSTPSCSARPLDLDAAAALADILRGHPADGQRHPDPRRVDTSVLAEAMRAGMRRGRRRARPHRPRRGRRRAHQVWQRCAGPPARPRATAAQADHGVLPQGRRRQDHDGGQPRRSRWPTRRAPRSASSTSTSPSATSRSPCSCSRRTRSRDAVGLEERPRLRAAADRCSPGTESGSRVAGRADAARRAGPDHRRRWSRRVLAALREPLRLRRRRHLRRPSTSRSSRPSTRPTSASSWPRSTSPRSRTSRSPSRPSTCSTRPAHNRHLVLNRADEEVGLNQDNVEGILGMKVVGVPAHLVRRSPTPPTPASRSCCRSRTTQLQGDHRPGPPDRRRDPRRRQARTARRGRFGRKK